MKYFNARRNIKVFFIISLMFFNVSLFSEEQTVTDAWTAYNNKNYELAIKYANECIELFSRDAEIIQNNLIANKARVPPVGTVSTSDKTWIFNLGLLNDVATALFIKGRSAEYLYFNNKNLNTKYKMIAENAYNELKKYQYGRTWDPKGWFWSPYDTAMKRIPL